MNTHRLLCLILVLCLLSGCTPAPQSAPSSSQTVSEETLPPADPAHFREIDGKLYYDVKKAGAVGNGRRDVSAYFRPDVERYYIDAGVYLLDEDTLRRVLQTPCMGSGMVQWTEYYDRTGTTEAYAAAIPVSRFNDPLYTYMVLPTEMKTVMNRRNPNNLATPVDGRQGLNPIAAVYKNAELELPDDAEITFCIGFMKLALYTKQSQEWFLASDLPVSPYPGNLYYYPWESGNQRLPNSRVKLVDDHWEVTVTGAEFNGKTAKTGTAKQGMLHFWGDPYYVDNGEDVVAMACSYEIWLKDDTWADYVGTTVGIDIYGKTITQAFYGTAYKLTTEPRVIYGHTVGGESYYKIMDTEKVQKLLGLS